MDNRKQIDEILRYRERLSRLTGKRVDTETAAYIWIRHYARLWRLRHPRSQKQFACSSS
jgi:hypothetical protein